MPDPCPCGGATYAACCEPYHRGAEPADAPTLMRLGWKVFVPLTLVWILVIGVWMMSPLSIWK